MPGGDRARRRSGRRQRPEYAERTRFVVLMLLAPVFLVALPALFVMLGTGLDHRMHLPPSPPPPVNLIVGIPLVVAGGALGLWSNSRLFTAGRGTPLPLMPTQRLIIDPPYAWSRNPMALGAINLYLGVAILFRSPGAVLVVALSAAALLTFIRFGEERMMLARFGPAYEAYRRRTPFLFPHPGSAPPAAGGPATLRRARRRGP